MKGYGLLVMSVANICNQLLRAGTGIGANNAEATNAVSRQDGLRRSGGLLEMRNGVKKE